MAGGLFYLGDIAVFSKSPAGRTKPVRRILLLHYEDRVTLKLKKYEFFAETIDYLGHFIRSGLLELAERTIHSVTKLENPTMSTEMRSF